MTVIYPMHEVLSREYPILQETLSESKIKNLFYLILGLARDFDAKCEVVSLEEITQLWLLFPNSCMDCSMFSHEYKEILYTLQDEFELTVHGVSEAYEPASLMFHAKEKQLTVTYQNISGNPFFQLYAIHLQMNFSNEVTGRFVKSVLTKWDFSKPLIAVEPYWKNQLKEKDLFETDTDIYYYDYIVLEESEQRNELLKEALSLKQLAKLWEIFLNEQVTPYELSLFEQGTSHLELFRLEMSLRIALLHSKIRVVSEQVCLASSKSSIIKLAYPVAQSSISALYQSRLLGGSVASMPRALRSLYSQRACASVPSAA